MSAATADLLARLRERGASLWVDEGRLRCEAPAGALDEELRAELVEHKHELLELLGAAEAARAAPRSLVPLKPTGTLPALFARPGHNGDVFCYRPLAAHIDEDRPLYGVEPMGLDGGPTAETVEEMAAYEVAQIRALQPSGPYHLAGYCAGGTIAFESARQLVGAGEQVARLVLFGAPFPITYRTSGASLYLRSVTHRVRRHSANLTAGSLTEGIEYVRDRVARRLADAEPESREAVANRVRVEEATMDAVRRYEPGFYGGRVDIVLPSESWRRSGDDPDAWRTVAARIVEHVGPDRGDGDEMLLEPFIASTTALLEQALRDEEDGCG